MLALGVNVVLYDAVDTVHERLAQRYAGHAGIRVLNPSEWEGPLPPGWVDLILVNSVIQYLPRQAFEALLPKFRRLLSKRGRLVIADVIPPDASMLGDIAALLRPAARHGFLVAALFGLAATFFSDYRRLRRTLGLTSYSAQEMIAVLARHGFTCERRSKNIGFNRSRMTFVARPAD
jgi:SAM-dependent methyltransferase